MKWLWLIVSVVVGYVVSQIINMLVVLTFYTKGSEAGAIILIISVVILGAAGFATGIIVSLISRNLKNSAAIITAALVLLVTILNIYLDVAIEPLAHKLVVLFAMVPAIVIGARFKRGRAKVTNE